MKKNKEFLVAGIRNLLKTNYGVEKDLIDVEAEVDSEISFSENWNHLKSKYNLRSNRELMEMIKTRRRR